MHYSTYVIKSETTGMNYYGSCKDLQLRLKQHNMGKVRFTKSKRPWKLIYFEEFESRSEAYQRERFFKSIDGYLFLKKNGLI